jgi:hypothetical protein
MFNAAAEVRGHVGKRERKIERASVAATRGRREGEEKRRYGKAFLLTAKSASEVWTRRFFMKDYGVLVLLPYTCTLCACKRTLTTIVGDETLSPCLLDAVE